MTGIAAELKAALISQTPPVTDVTPVRINGLGALAITENSGGAISLADVNILIAGTTGVVTATGADGTLAAYTHADTGLQGSGNAKRLT